MRRGRRGKENKRKMNKIGSRRKVGENRKRDKRNINNREER